MTRLLMVVLGAALPCAAFPATTIPMSTEGAIYAYAVFLVIIGVPALIAVLLAAGDIKESLEDRRRRYTCGGARRRGGLIHWIVPAGRVHLLRFTAAAVLVIAFAMAAAAAIDHGLAAVSRTAAGPARRLADMDLDGDLPDGEPVGLIFPAGYRYWHNGRRVCCEPSSDYYKRIIDYMHPMDRPRVVRRDGGFDIYYGQSADSIECWNASYDGAIDTVEEYLEHYVEGVEGECAEFPYCTSHSEEIAAADLDAWLRYRDDYAPGEWVTGFRRLPSNAAGGVL